MEEASAEPGAHREGADRLGAPEEEMAVVAAAMAPAWEADGEARVAERGMEATAAAR